MSKIFSSFLRKKPSRALVEKGLVSPNKPVPKHIKLPEYALNGIVPPSPSKVILYSEADIPKLRKAGKLARKMLEYACSLAKPGVTTDYIDSMVFEETIKHNAYPSPINYMKFPKSICTSVNEVVCHGIPDDRILLPGDILSIDVSIYVDGFHGDNCGTVIVGDADKLTSESDIIARKLVQANKDVLDLAIQGCYPGQCLSNIGNTIDTEAKKRGFQIVSHFCGHGVGRLMHMQPYVLHHQNTEKFTLVPGMVFTIEPILVEGEEDLVLWDDNWTAATADNSRGSQFEHEILITKDGNEILTSL